MIKNKNYKIILGVIVGVIISVSVVYAASYVSSNIIYDSTNNSLSTGDVQGAIDDLANKINNAKPTTCPDGYLCTKYKTTANDLELGDYVLYTPVVESYPIDTAYTGYSSSKTIYPNELTIWRVLNKNEDGSVEIISDYVSSTNVAFSGQTGYLNFVGYLNALAKQYETEGITAGSRHFGYNGQTEYLDSTKVKFTYPSPFTNSTTDNSNEDIGGGDVLYEEDYNDVNTVLGTRIAFEVGTTTATSYWIAARHYSHTSSSKFAWMAQYVNTSGECKKSSLYNYGYGSGLLSTEGGYSSSSTLLSTRKIYGSSKSDNIVRPIARTFSSVSSGGYLRPIITLKSGLEYYGLGTKENPIEIITT